jgi:hypothetical protein
MSAASKPLSSRDKVRAHRARMRVSRIGKMACYRHPV